MVEHVESVSACHRCKEQFYRNGTERSSSLANWIPPGPEPVPSKLLRVSAGIYPARNGEFVGAIALSLARRFQVNRRSIRDGSRPGFLRLDVLTLYSMASLPIHSR